MLTRFEVFDIVTVCTHAHISSRTYININKWHFKLNSLLTYVFICLNAFDVFLFLNNQSLLKSISHPYFEFIENPVWCACFCSTCFPGTQQNVFHTLPFLSPHIHLHSLACLVFHFLSKLSLHDTSHTVTYCTCIQKVCASNPGQGQLFGLAYSQSLHSDIRLVLWNSSWPLHQSAPRK
jgi:hypothetical protein